MEYDKRLCDVRTGDVALSTRDDIAGIFITWFTQSTIQHSAIFVWYNRDDCGELNVCAKYEENCRLALLHVTKRRMFDLYSGKISRGLVLCSIDEYVKRNLITVYRRSLSRDYINDKDAADSVKRYMKKWSGIMEYESDIRTIFGVPLNIPYAPYVDRKICTALIYDYLHESFDYPRKGFTRIPMRDPNTYRAVDFMEEYNDSKVFDGKEDVVFGIEANVTFCILHPFNILMVLGLLLVIILISIACRNQ